MPKTNSGRHSLDRGIYKELAQLTVRVDQRTRDVLHKLGEGSCSAGIRLLAASYGKVALADLVEFRATQRALRDPVSDLAPPGVPIKKSRTPPAKARPARK